MNSDPIQYSASNLNPLHILPDFFISHNSVFHTLFVRHVGWCILNTLNTTIARNVCISIMSTMDGWARLFKYGLWTKVATICLVFVQSLQTPRICPKKSLPHHANLNWAGRRKLSANWTINWILVHWPQQCAQPPTTQGWGIWTQLHGSPTRRISPCIIFLGSAP